MIETRSAATQPRPGRNHARTAILCILLALLSLAIIFGTSGYTSGRFTDFEAGTSSPIAMKTYGVVVVVVEGDPGSFDVTTDLQAVLGPTPGFGPADCLPTSFTLVDAPVTLDGCDAVRDGTYSLTLAGEDTEAAISCDDANSGPSGDIDDPPNTATIIVDGSEKVTCTFTFTAVEPLSSLAVSPSSEATLSVAIDSSDGEAGPVALHVACSIGAPEKNGLSAIETAPAQFTILGVPEDGTSCSAAPQGVVEGYTADASGCLGVAVEPGASVACTIILDQSSQGSTPSAATGSIMVSQQGDGVSLPYTLTPAAGDCDTGAFLLTDDDSRLCAGLEAGAYTVELATLPAGWQLSVDCEAASSAVTQSTNAVDIELASGDQVVCLFVLSPEAVPE